MGLGGGSPQGAYPHINLTNPLALPDPDSHPDLGNGAGAGDDARAWDRHDLPEDIAPMARFTNQARLTFGPNLSFLIFNKTARIINKPTVTFLFANIADASRAARAARERLKHRKPDKMS